MSRFRYVRGHSVEQLFRAMDRLLGRVNDRRITTTYTATEDDDTILGAASGGAFTITLPTVDEALRGKLFTIVKTDNSVNAITVQGTGGQTIDGSASASVSAQYSPKRLRAVQLSSTPTYGYLSA